MTTTLLSAARRSVVVALLAGLAMTVLPGPAIVVLPAGMAMLAAEFAWASRVLDVGIERARQREHPEPRGRHPAYR